MLLQLWEIYSGHRNTGTQKSKLDSWLSATRGGIPFFSITTHMRIKSQPWSKHCLDIGHQGHLAVLIRDK